MILNILACVFMLCAEPDSTITLNEVMVKGNKQRDYQMKSSQSATLISQEYLQNNYAASLMQTLEKIPGVKAMAIGSGQSKPIIRGLGFNRMLVSEDGIKHEGQQWGDDHGLEIDQFAIDRAEVVKGPAALFYGGDAIGGVLQLYTNHVPRSNFEGSVQLFGRTNNDQLGVSAKVGGRKGSFFYRANITLIDYADYKIPADSIQYYSYWIKLKDRKMRNTAGLERDASLMLGYAGYHWHSFLRVSDSYSKSGFFANAHGLEVRLSDIDYDSSSRDISLPYQSVNHLKILSHTMWHNEVIAAEANLAFQNNYRSEYAEKVSHGYMPMPSSTLERRFIKNTYTMNSSLSWQFSERNLLRTGVNVEHQHNRKGGWGFIIPDFEISTIGLYLSEKYTVTDKFLFNIGVRYDHSSTHVASYKDWYQTPVDGTMTFMTRAADIRRHFNSVTWSAGVNYLTGNWVLKANVGKSFRIPIPKELGADGINYHIFRYERGNARLDPEESYQLDASVNWSLTPHVEGRRGCIMVQFEPYINYFPNYIYLNPSSEYVEGLQLYQYTQARVLRYGCEAQVVYNPTDRIEIEAKGEYLYARQRSGEKRGFTLPFSMPMSLDASVKYSFGKTHDGYLLLNAHSVGAQHEIVPPEKPTPGYFTLNASAGKKFSLGETTIRCIVHADNLLNRKYYNHTSYYRLIDVPEAGFNMSIMLGIDF